MGTAADRVADVQELMTDLQAELEAEVADIRAQWDERATAVDTLSVPLEKSDVRVTSIGLVWIPTGS